MRVHGRRRREPHGLADIPHGGRVAVLGRIALDEVEDLLLALGEVHLSGLLARHDERGCSNVCSYDITASDGNKHSPQPPRSARDLGQVRGYTGRPLAAVAELVDAQG